MSIKIAIQGNKASFHDIAAIQYFGKDIELVCCDSFKDTFAAVREGMAQYAVCAIENSLYGSINETYDLLLQHHYSIIGEVYLHIEQCLIGLPGTKVKDIKEVRSHLVALAQCERYLDTYLPTARRIETHDTAASVEDIKNLGNPVTAAIASREAAELHGMEILASHIETNHQNYTRFIIFARHTESVANASKTSLVITTAHQPGSLYRALGAFAKETINLSKLQSRPIIGKAWHYIFYVDVDAGVADPRLKAAINELTKQDCKTTILGSYMAGDKQLT